MTVSVLCFLVIDWLTSVGIPLAWALFEYNIGPCRLPKLMIKICKKCPNEAVVSYLVSATIDHKVERLFYTICSKSLVDWHSLGSLVVQFSRQFEILCDNLLAPLFLPTMTCIVGIINCNWECKVRRSCSALVVKLLRISELRGVSICFPYPARSAPWTLHDKSYLWLELN